MVHAEMRRVEGRFDALEKATEQAFENSQRAIDKADMATEKRFEGVNEFRAALADQANKFVTAEQLTATVGRLEAGYTRNREDIDALNDRMNLREGQAAGSRLTYGTMAALLAAFATIIGLLVVAANWVSGS